MVAYNRWHGCKSQSGTRYLSYMWLSRNIFIIHVSLNLPIITSIINDLKKMKVKQFFNSNKCVFVIHDKSIVVLDYINYMWSLKNTTSPLASLPTI